MTLFILGVLVGVLLTIVAYVARAYHEGLL